MVIKDWRTRNKRINDHGYIERYVPDHPYTKDGWVLEHRLVMEEFLDRFLEEHEVVHHVNEVKTDNRIDNLWLCSSAEHTKIHRLGVVPKQNTRAKIRQARIRKMKRSSPRRDISGRFLPEITD